MAGKAFTGNFKAWLLETEPAAWNAAEDPTVTSAEMEAGTRLLRLVSNGGVAFTFNANTASQSKVDDGRTSHYADTEEVSDLAILHEADFPLADDAMWNLYNYGDKRWLVVSPDGIPETTGQVLHVFEIETMSKQAPLDMADQAIQNFRVPCAVQAWNLDATYQAAA